LKTVFPETEIKNKVEIKTVCKGNDEDLIRFMSLLAMKPKTKACKQTSYKHTHSAVGQMIDQPHEK